jgi:ribonuclease HI
MEKAVWIDGACLGNPGPGGWAVVIPENNADERELSGHEALTTNNRMELQAAIQALRAVQADHKICIHTDSSYLVAGITQWIHSWKRNNWTIKGKEPVKNADLWQVLDALVRGRTVEWKWVKGHAGDVWNNIANSLALRSAKGQN